MSNLTSKVIFAACVSAVYDSIKGKELSSDPFDYIKPSAPFVLSVFGTILYDYVTFFCPTIKTVTQNKALPLSTYDNETDKTQKVVYTTKYEMYSVNLVDYVFAGTAFGGLTAELILSGIFGYSESSSVSACLIIPLCVVDTAAELLGWKDYRQCEALHEINGDSHIVIGLENLDWAR